MGECLGRGGFGEVYRATMRTAGGLETDVALKVLRADVARADAMARFRDEGRLLARFQHPVAVRAFDWASLEGTPALVTEYVDGFDAAAVVGAIPPRPALEVAAAVASALDAAWTTPGPDGRPLRIVHRDLKPSNVRLGRHGQVKLLDFGIAVFATPDRESKTRSAVLVGSLPYMAPERFTARDSSPPVDVYGLGCCLYELLAGEPFHARARLRDLSALALAPREADALRAERLGRLPADLPPPVRALLDRCLRPDPSERPLAGALAAEWGALAAAAPGPTLRRFCAEASPPPRPVSPGPWTGRALTEDEEPPASPGAAAARVVPAADTLALDDAPARADGGRSSALRWGVGLGCLLAAGCGLAGVGAGLLAAALRWAG